MNVPSFWVSLAGEDSSTVIEFRPECIMEEDLESLSSKFPLIPGSQGSITFCTTRLSEKLREMPQNADFDLTDPYSLPPAYNVLHDPHLKEYFQNPAMRRRLLEKGFVTSKGYVKCTLREFNLFRQWIRKLKLDRLHQDLRKEREDEIEAWKEKQAQLQLLRDEELYSIIRMREEKAKELQDRARRRREAERRKYLKLEDEYRRRREKFEEDRRRRKDWKESQRERTIAERYAMKCTEEEKVKKIKIRILAKHKEDDRARQHRLENRRQSLVDEKKQKLKEQWKRRCSFSLCHLMKKQLLEEEEREEHLRKVSRRTSLVERQHRRCEVFHDQCLQKRRNTLVQQHHDADLFLENIRRRKLRDLARWKQKYIRMRDGHSTRRMSLGSKASLGHKGRSRLSSIWDLESSLRKDFGIEDNVVYSGVVMGDTKPRTATLETVEEEDVDAETREKERFDKLLAKLEGEIALRDKVHHVVFGIISKAQNILEIEEIGLAHEGAKAVQRYVEDIINDAHETNEKACDFVGQATENAQLRESAKEMVFEATSSAVKTFKKTGLAGSKDLSATARHVATGAVDAAKASLERLYGTSIELVEDEGDLATQEISKKLSESAKVIAAAAIVSATRSLELSLGECDPGLIEARSLAADAVEAAKASLERLYGITIELGDESESRPSETPKTLAESAKDIAAAAIISATASLERAIDEDNLNLIAARSLATDAVKAAKASLERLHGVKIEQHRRKLTTRRISKTISQSAKHIAASAIISAKRSLERAMRSDDMEMTVAAKSLASDAVVAAKTSLERLYNVAVHREGEKYSQEMSKCFAESAKDISQAAILSATRSLERMMKEDDFNVIVARSLAKDAMEQSKASLERLYGTIFHIEDEDYPSVEDMSNSIARAAKDVAEAAIASATKSLEMIRRKGDVDVIARSLASNKLDAAKVSRERVCGTNVVPEDKTEHVAKEIAAAAVISATRHLDKVMEEEDVCRGLANDAIGSAKLSLQRLYGIKIEPEETKKLQSLEMTKSLMASAKDVAAAAITTASRLLGDSRNDGDLEATTRVLVSSALDSARTSLKSVNVLKIEMLDESGTWQCLGSEDGHTTAAVTSTMHSLQRLRGKEVVNNDFSEVANTLAHDAIHSAKASIERFYGIEDELEDHIVKTAEDISRALVDSSENPTKQLEDNGLAQAARNLACCAIISAAESSAMLQQDKVSVKEVVSCDTNLLEAARKVSEISVSASRGEIFDRGFFGGTEMEEAANHLATQSLLSAQKLVERMEDDDRTAALDLEVCKAARELVSQDRFPNKFSQAGSRVEGVSPAREQNLVEGTIFWKVTAYVEGIVNSTLRYLGSPRDLSELCEPEVEKSGVSYSEASIADDELVEPIDWNDLYQQEVLALKASRIVNDVLENAIDVFTTSVKNDAFFQPPESGRHKPGAVPFRHKRSGSVHFNEKTILHSRRESYVPRETDFLSAARRPPTPRFRKDQEASFVFEEMEGLEKEFAVSPDDDLTSEDVCSQSVKRLAPDLGSGSNSEVRKDELSAPSATKDKPSADEDEEPALPQKSSLYDVIKGREGRASCGLSPSSSYVVLPRLDPSERSLIAARVEGLEDLWNQKKATPSVTNLPSLSPKGSLVTCETAIEQPKAKDEARKPSAYVSSSLPDLSSSTRPSLAPSSSTGLLKETKGQPVKVTSQRAQQSPLTSPRASKQSTKLSSKPAPCPRTSKKKITSSCSSLVKAETSSRGSLENASASPGAPMKKAQASPRGSAEKVASSRDPPAKASLSPCSSTQRAKLPKQASGQDVAASSKASTQSTAKVSAEKRSRTSVEKVALSRRSSVEKTNVSPSTSQEKTTFSTRVSTDKTGVSPSVSKRQEKVAAPGLSAASSSSSLSPRVSKPRVSSTTSAGKSTLSPRASIATHKSMEASVSSSSGLKSVPVKSSKDTTTVSPKSSGVSVKVASSKQSTRLEKQNFTLRSKDAETKTEVPVKERADSKEKAGKELSGDPDDLCGTSPPVKPEADIGDLRKGRSLEHSESLPACDRGDSATKDAPVTRAEKTSPCKKSVDETGLIERKGPLETDQNLKRAVHSLDRIIQERRLTPEGAEADPRPTSNADNTASKKQTSRSFTSFHVDSSGTDRLSVKKAPPPSLSDSGIKAKDRDGSSLSGEGSLVDTSRRTKTGGKDSISRRKPEGKDQDEEGHFLAQDKEREPSATEVSGSTELKQGQPAAGNIGQSVESSQEPQKGEKSSSRASSGGSYSQRVVRKVSVSSSINDTMEDLLDRMLSMRDDAMIDLEATAKRRRRGSHEKTVPNDQGDAVASTTPGRNDDRMPAAKVSESVIKTVECMLQNACCSDERRSGRRLQGLKAGHGVPRVTSREGLPKRRASTQEFQIVQDIYPTPPLGPKPQLPSPRRSRAKATLSRESLGLRATRSDSSISSTSSGQAADLKPKVSGAWLDDAGGISDSAFAKDSQLKRPHSSPTTPQHRRSVEGISAGHALKVEPSASFGSDLPQ